MSADRSLPRSASTPVRASLRSADGREISLAAAEHKLEQMRHAVRPDVPVVHVIIGRR